ncbi:helix-turn-helix domain-containing protein [Zunongwangia profunda]|uniref:helix-turn-helix domain-containing protein n=1 Tax=Zunongwangia profunda TaxID=398743 RepID=UPI0026D6D120|tara:strand:- start:290 stop:628 length:339 start_codon:yes stop_codon:yes gene_type:complete
MIYHTINLIDKSEIYQRLNRCGLTEKEKLGKYLTKLRQRVPSEEYSKDHISQQELADNNGLTKYLIGTIERGEANPTLDKLIFLAKALKLKKVNIFEIEINVDRYIKEIKNK